MRFFRLSKLVRDNLPDLMQDDNQVICGQRTLGEEEFLKELVRKLEEEAQEVALAEDREPLIKELAEVQEVINYLKNVLKVSKDEFERALSKKRRSKGGFDKRVFIDIIGLQDDDKFVDCYLNEPNRFPEVRNPNSK